MAAAILCVLVTATGLSAQLGKVAKKEAERRKTVTPGKVYTNDTLLPAPEPSSVPASAGSSSTAAPSSSAPEAEKSTADASSANKPAADKPADAKDNAASSKVSDDPGERKKEEAKWRERIKTERDALERAKSYADALQVKINSLNTDFVNRDDPVQRASIAAQRDTSLAELDRLKKEIADRTKAIGAIQEEGRKAGVPAGWLR